MKTGEWTEIFRAGDYGSKGSYTETDLDGMVANFNTEDQVPIVVGHPETDSPAWGWLAELKRTGKILLGRIGELHRDFAQAIDEGKFRNRSVRIVRTESGPKLLHLGFLGAILPQVEGLRQTAQFAGEGECVDYGFELSGQPGRQDSKEEEMVKDEQIKKLQDDLAAEKAARAQERQDAEKAASEAKKAEFSRFIETEMVAKGKLPQARKDEVTAFMMSLPAGESADFSYGDEGETKTVKPVQWFQDFVKSLPAADFTRELPAGPAAATTGPERRVDLSHKV